jgi:hypothetical protein
MRWIWLSPKDFWYTVRWCQLSVVQGGPVPFAKSNDTVFALYPPVDPYGSPLPSECWTGNYSYLNY